MELRTSVYMTYQTRKFVFPVRNKARRKYLTILVQGLSSIKFMERLTKQNIYLNIFLNFYVQKIQFKAENNYGEKY